MRKISYLLMFVLCITFSTQIYAQLNIQAKNDKFENLGTLRTSYMWLFAQSNDYYINIRTTNQFDDNTLFCLGETAENAIQTAKDMIALIENTENNASIEVVDAKGVRTTLIKKRIVGKPYWELIQEGHAGSSNVTPKELETAIKIISSHSISH